MAEPKKRALLKAVAGGILIGKALPQTWSKPVVDYVILPAHATTSGCSSPPATISNSSEETIFTGEYTPATGGGVFRRTPDFLSDRSALCTDGSELTTQTFEEIATITDGEPRTINLSRSAEFLCGGIPTCTLTSEFKGIENSSSGTPAGPNYWTGETTLEITCCTDRFDIDSALG